LECCLLLDFICTAELWQQAFEHYYASCGKSWNCNMNLLENNNLFIAIVPEKHV